jgi:hypothetical protein
LIGQKATETCKEKKLTVLITPTFPFNAPPTALNASAMAKVVENPNPTAEIPVPNSPTSKTFFLPMISLSAALPHAIAVKNWAKVNADARAPACQDIVEAGSDGSKDWS